MAISYGSYGSGSATLYKFALSKTYDGKIPIWVKKGRIQLSKTKVQCNLEQMGRPVFNELKYWVAPTL